MFPSSIHISRARSYRIRARKRMPEAAFAFRRVFKRRDKRYRAFGPGTCPESDKRGLSAKDPQRDVFHGRKSAGLRDYNIRGIPMHSISFEGSFPRGSAAPSGQERTFPYTREKR